MSRRVVKTRKSRSQNTQTVQSSAKPWTTEEQSAFTTGVIRGLHTNVRKAARKKVENSAKNTDSLKKQQIERGGPVNHR